MGNRGKMEENLNIAVLFVKWLGRIRSPSNLMGSRENTRRKVAIVPGPSEGHGIWSQAGPGKPISNSYYNVQVYL